MDKYICFGKGIPLCNTVQESDSFIFIENHEEQLKNSSFMFYKLTKLGFALNSCSVQPAVSIVLRYFHQMIKRNHLFSFKAI